MTHTRESRKIAAAIIGLGNSLDLVTVAEGIENQTHADMLLWLGCEVGQGWLYGRPVSADQLPTLLAAKPHPPSSASTAIYADTTMPLRHEAAPTLRLAQLHAIYDGVPVGLCFLDRNLRYVSVNKRLAEISNTPVALHLGRTVAEVFPDLYPRFEPYLQRALLGEAIIDMEIREPNSKRPDEFSTYLVSYQPARDEAEEVIGISVSVVDITKRKHAEEALIESEDDFRHTVELNPQVPWTADPTGKIIDVSHRWETVTGCTREQALGEGWLRVLHPDDIQHTRAAWATAIRSGEPPDIHYRVRRHDGIWRWMRARAYPRRNDKGQIIRWYGTVEDVDDYKKTQQALQRSEARLQTVLAAVPAGTIIAEAPDGRVIMSNPRAESILGRPLSLNIEEYIQSIAYRPDGTRLQPHDHPLTRALQGKTASAEQLLYQRTDGTRTWTSLSAAPIFTPDGQVAGGVVAIQPIDDQDIDEEKRKSPPEK
jgi:PAS domain S-box-containing protein